MFAQDLSYSHSGQKFVYHEDHEEYEETIKPCSYLFFVPFVPFVVKSLFASGLSGLEIYFKIGVLIP